MLSIQDLGWFPVALAWIALALAGCSSTPDVRPPGETLSSELDGAPLWVTRSCAAFPDDEQKQQICGVGAAGGTANPSLARRTAIARARTDIARTLTVKVRSMLKDYQATTTGGEEYGIAAADEQHVVDVSKQITNMTLAGTEPVDLWVSESGTFYALVVLDLEKFQDSVARMDSLSENIRRAVEQRAAEAFAELDEEIQRASND